MTWLLLPFGIFGLWGTGVGALALYAAASFFWTQRHVHRRSSAPPAD
jgi:predicted LPLAT superfamily acyltransferase